MRIYFPQVPQVSPVPAPQKRHFRHRRKKGEKKFGYFNFESSTGHVRKRARFSPSDRRFEKCRRAGALVKKFGRYSASEKILALLYGCTVSRETLRYSTVSRGR